MRIYNNLNIKSYKNKTSFASKPKVFDEAAEKALLLAAETSEKNLKAAGKVLKETYKEKESPKWATNFLVRIANSGWFKKIAESKNADILAYILVLGNAAKEAMGTTIYTIQALTNDDLPPDKRKFVGMYDLAVGLASTTITLVGGVLMVKGQRALINKLVGGKSAERLPGYVKAVSGLSFMLPIVLQTIIGKRIIAPAIATPIAGTMKKRGEDKAKKAPNMEPVEALILAHNENNFKQKLDKGI